MKQRLDARVVAEGLAATRSAAQRLIMAGVVRIDGQRADKAGTTVRDNQDVSVDAPARFVSRGGDKLDNGIEDLAAAITQLGVSIEAADAIDIGASTGGFTDCLLQRGAARVIAVDVGYGQLHPRLRNDARVTVMERTNARHLAPSDLPFAPTLLVCDASFIPLATVLPGPMTCMQTRFWGLVLCKPQFEAGRERLTAAGRKGVITDPDVRSEILNETLEALRRLGLTVEAVAEARPRGPKGNVEYVVLVHRP